MFNLNRFFQSPKLSINTSNFLLNADKKVEEKEEKWGAKKPHKKPKPKTLRAEDSGRCSSEARLRRRTGLPGGRPSQAGAIDGSGLVRLCECPQLSSVRQPGTHWPRRQAPVLRCASLGAWLPAASGARPVPPESLSLSRHAHLRGDWGWASCLAFRSVSRWPGSGAVGVLGSGAGPRLAWFDRGWPSLPSPAPLTEGGGGRQMCSLGKGATG